jgi:hypothetical protein
MGSIRTWLLQKGTFYGINKDFSVKRIHIIWVNKNLSVTRRYNIWGQ